MLFALVLFTGCSALATYITNADSDYEIIPIKIEQGFLKKPKIHIGNYYLRQTKSISSDISLGKLFEVNDIYRDKTGHKYAFYRNDTLMGESEIYKKEAGIKSSSSSLSISSTYNNIIIDGLAKEYTILGIRDENYVVYSDNLIGTVVIKNYHSKNKNNPDDKWTFHTGFEIFVNNESYGILGFYPDPILYIKNNNRIITKESEDRLMLYIITSFQTFREME